MEEYIDINLSLQANSLLIEAYRETLCWLMHHVSLEREDSWRDRKFNEIQDKLNYLTMERGVLLEALNNKND